jgi:hypothetical protein
MSGEFGSYEGGYLWYQIELAANDVRGGSDKSTRAWADFFAVLVPLARDICWAEANDSDEARTVQGSIEAIPKLRDELIKLERHFEVYREVSERAVAAALKKAQELP